MPSDLEVLVWFEQCDKMCKSIGWELEIFNTNFAIKDEYGEMVVVKASLKHLISFMEGVLYIRKGIRS